MKMKTILFMLLTAVLSVASIMTVKAATISDDGEYTLVLRVMDLYDDDASIDGEYAVAIRFNVAEGEETVKLSELTKGIIPFNGKTQFSHWETKNKEKADEELSIKDFTLQGNIYTSAGEEITYKNGLMLDAKFSDKGLEESGKYYVTLDSFGGKINGKAKVLLENEASEFTTIDLTKYTPERNGCTFKGWDLDGKIVTSVDSSAFSKNVSIKLTATYTQNTFDGNDRVLILNANGGTIDGEAIGRYDYLGDGNTGTEMSLLPYIPEREGYTFNGWNSQKDGSGQNYKYIYWRLWDQDRKEDIEKDTIIRNEYGAGYYQNLTLYASWTKIPTEPDEETVKEIQSTGDIKAKIEFADEVSNDYKLEVTQIDVSKELADKNVKFIVDINLIYGEEVLEINGFRMKIRIALPDDLQGYDKYEVVYIRNGEIIKDTIPATIEDGYVVFETDHLSQYGIIATNTSVPADDDDNNAPKTDDDNNAPKTDNDDNVPKTDEDDIAPKTDDDIGPKTGDASSPALWMALLFAGSGATILLINKKKY